jgi:hypothetical protein
MGHDIAPSRLRWSHWSVSFCLLVVLLFGISGQTIAQTVTGTILGNVLDPSGSAVANAQITVTNQDTGVARSTVSTSGGVYNVPSLIPGKYSVEAKVPGFSVFQIKDAVVTVGSDTRVDLNLQVGATTQSVTVTEAAPTIEATTAEVSQLMDENSIKDVPLNNRDLQQLAEIQPGVQYNYYSPFGNQLSIAGDRPSHNRYLQEGIDLTWTYRTAASSLPSGVLLGVEAVSEFKVLTTDFPAEYGELAGGVINTTFKSGTNSLHGSAYEFYRNGIFDAKNYFDRRTSVTGQALGTPPLHRNQFGASLGGPIRKGNTFFFVNYEGYRLNASDSDVADLPTDGERSLASRTTYSIFFAPGSGGTGGPLLPECNGPVVPNSLGLCYFSSNPIHSVSENYGLVKIDHTFGTKNTLSATYNIDPSAEYEPVQTAATADDQYERRQTFTIQDSHIVSPNLVNTARFGVNRIYYNSEVDIVGDPSKVNPLLFVNPQPIYTRSIYPQVPSISVGGGMQAFGASVSPFAFAPRYIGYTAGDLTDDINYLHGKHAFQFGIEGKRWDDDINISNSGSRGVYTFQNLAQFLAGGPAQSFTWFVQKDTTNGGQVISSTLGRDMRLHMVALYAEDTYKAKPNLTLTFGLRWEYVPGPSEASGRISSLNNPTPLTASAPIVGGSYYNPSKHNFGPRLGFNWDPSRKGTTSIRGGFGMFYNEIEDDTWYAQVGVQPPFTYSVALSNLMTFPYSSTVLNTAIANGLKQNYQGTVSRNPATPTKYGYNLTVQHELPQHLTLLVAYVGAQSRHFGRVISWQDYNPSFNEAPGQAPPFAGAVANPNCTQAGQVTCLYWDGIGVENRGLLTSTGAVSKTPVYNNPNFGATVTGTVFDANSFYNSLQTALERRVSPGLYVRFNYTYAECVTDATDDQAGGDSTGGSSGEIVTLNHKSSRARCAFQGMHAANLTLTYDSPFGRMVHSEWAKDIVSNWEINSLTTVASGSPFDVRDGINASRYAATGTGLDRPNWAPGCNAQNAINPHDPVNYFKTSCFTLAPLGYQGDVGALPLIAPTLADTDVSLLRSVPLKREGMALQLRVDMFNAFNRTNFAGPTNITAFTNTGTTLAPIATPSGTAGQITRTVTSSRQFQFSARFQF